MSKNTKSIETLEPVIFWKHFAKILSIPHPSKKEKVLADYIYNWGKEQGLETIMDEVGNVIMRKPASSPEFANRKRVLLQSHIDMVPQKAENKQHDFEKDPIKAYLDEDGFVKAEGTTLGADNGIGVAATLAIFESKNIPHGPLEALFTIDEETGMTGAFGLKPGVLQSDIMLNLDCDGDQEIFVGCAGGIDTVIEFNFKKESVPANNSSFLITVSGLRGGHSGADIHEGRGNAIKILARILYDASKKFNILLSDINGGTLRNVIPSKASGVVSVENKSAEEFSKFVTAYANTIRTELAFAEPNCNVTIVTGGKPAFSIDSVTQSNLIKSLYACPNGVIRMDDQMAGLTETSTNLGVINVEGDIIKIATLQRSSSETPKLNVAGMVAATFELAKASAIKIVGGYPGWKPNLNSVALKMAKEAFKNLFNKEPRITAIHGGLECAIIGDKYPNMQMVAFGPNIKDAHSISERVEFASVERFWKLLCEILKNAPVS